MKRKPVKQEHTGWKDGDPDVVMGSARSRSLVTDIVDPFTATGEDLKKIAGLSANQKRNRTRTLEKRFTGHEDTGTKRDETEAQVDAYNLFSVVLPKYNMDYLAKIFEMSA